MKKYSPPPKAYKNLEFLNSADARTIRILSEFYEPKSRFKKGGIVDTVVFFGSARLTSRKDAAANLKKVKSELTKSGKPNSAKIKQAEILVEMSKYYEDAVELSKRLTLWSKSLPMDEKRFIVCSGGGPGIMEAANKGAYLAKGTSVGLNISIPFEQFVNKYVDPKLAFEFHYFFMRKFWFAYLAKALIVFPGGFGTLDELMEMLTLMQTGKIKKEMKVIVFDKKYWEKIINFDALIQLGMISETDKKLFNFCDSVDEAFDLVTAHLKKHYLNNDHK